MENPTERLKKGPYPNVRLHGEGIPEFVYSGLPPRVGEQVLVSKEHTGVMTKGIVVGVRWEYHVSDDGDIEILINVVVEGRKD